MEPLDYSRSFLTWTRKPRPDDPQKGWGNSVRIQLLARTRITDAIRGSSEDFYLIAPCRSEWMYGDGPLFKTPSSDYLLAWARNRSLRFAPNLVDPMERPAVEPIEDNLTNLDTYHTPLANPLELKTDAEVVAVARSTRPVVVHTEISHGARRRGAILEYPVFTLNYHADHLRFQVDTGPLLWADLASEEVDPIAWLRLAHVVYNRFDRAEFVKRGPTPVVKDGREICKVEDYQDIGRQAARHTFFASG